MPHDLPPSHFSRFIPKGKPNSPQPSSTLPFAHKSLELLKMAGFCCLRTAIFANKSRQILSIVGLSFFFFFFFFIFFPEFISCLFMAAAVFVFLCGFSWLLQNPEIDHLEENPFERGAKCEEADEFGEGERLKVFLLGDHRKTEVISSSINGGNQNQETQCRSHFREIDRLDEHQCEKGGKFEDPDEFGEGERLKEFLVGDHRKAGVISSSINGGNQTQQTDFRSYPQESDKLEEHPCERGEKFEDPGEFFCEFGEVKRTEELSVADHRKTELVSSSINGGNHHQFHPPTGALGSMRKEKEWSRTLAGKLRESGGEPGGAGEEMDLLWEAYEKTEENRGGRRENSGEKRKSKKSKKNRIVDYLEDFDEEEGGNPQICCLKALKLSAGKMNFGMSKSGLLKISKSIRGIETGWLSRKKKRI